VVGGGGEQKNLKILFQCCGLCLNLQIIQKEQQIIIIQKN
jgi:hypothetical protein